MGRPRTKEILNESTRPICINHGCNKSVTVASYYKNGNAKWRSVCGHCSNAAIGKYPFADGVTQYRKNVCSNKDSRLGFKCPTDFKLIPSGYPVTEIDHIDGSDCNNTPNNVQELCVTCHKIKSMSSGDLVKRTRIS